jgi:hypothetical protein
MDALKAIGFFNDDSRQIPATWPELIQSVINAPACRCCAVACSFVFSSTELSPPCSGDALKDAVRDAILKALPHASPDSAIAFLQWLGVFDPSLNTTQSGSVVKTFCALLESKLKFVSSNSYVVPERHVTRLACTHPARETFWPCITKSKLSSRTARKCTSPSSRCALIMRALTPHCSYSSTMLAYGEPHGDTAMAVTVNNPRRATWRIISFDIRHVTIRAQVGVPAAIATQLLLDGRIAARGVVRPMDPAVYEPMLSLLEAEGIVMHEKRIA